MLWHEIAILAVLQGIAEFLPISSSGHLVIAADLLGVKKEGTLEVNIILHAGTLLSILVFYWHRIWRLLGEDRRVIGLLIVGTIPAVVVGLPLKKFAPDVLESSLLVGCMLPLTGLMLLWSRRYEDGQKDYQSLSYRQTVVLGLFQAFAILPGISRSGSTIFGGLISGLRRESAATFAFMMDIHVIASAVVLEMKDMITYDPTTGGTSLGLLAFGATLSFVVGLVSLSLLIKIIERGRLYMFAWWCIPLGVAVVIWQLS